MDLLAMLGSVSDRFGQLEREGCFIDILQANASHLLVVGEIRELGGYYLKTSFNQLFTPFVGLRYQLNRMDNRLRVEMEDRRLGVELRGVLSHSLLGFSRRNTLPVWTQFCSALNAQADSDDPATRHLVGLIQERLLPPLANPAFLGDPLALLGKRVRCHMPDEFAECIVHGLVVGQEAVQPGPAMLRLIVRGQIDGQALTAVQILGDTEVRLEIQDSNATTYRRATYEFI